MHDWAAFLAQTPPTLQHLAPLPPDNVAALYDWLWPLLGDLGLLAPHGAAVVVAPAARRFLAAGKRRTRTRRPLGAALRRRKAVTFSRDPVCVRAAAR